MTLRQQLKAQGIKLKSHAIGQHSTDCPQRPCQMDRAGSKPDCLQVTITSETSAKWKCRHCVWAGKVGNQEQVASNEPPQPVLPKSSPEGVKVEMGLPQEIYQYFEDRKIPRGVVNMLGIRWSEEHQAIGFPYVDHSGETTNMLLLQLPEQTTKLASNKRIRLYGSDKFDPNYSMVIVQREMDRLVLLACGMPNVYALPNGGHLPYRQHDEYDAQPDQYEYLTADAQLLATAKRIVIAMDNTPEGDTFKHEIARRVGVAKCSEVRFSRGTLSKTYYELGADEVCADINEGSSLPIKGLYEVRDFESQLLTFFEGGMSSGLSTGWDNVDELYTVMPGELTIVSGIPNSGKSEWVDALTMNLALQQGWKFAAFSPENGKEQHVTKLVEKRVEMPSDPKSSFRMSVDTYFSGAAWVQDHYYFIVADADGDMPTLDWILDKAASAVLRYGIRGLIIDPWNEIERVPVNGQNETESVSIALSKMKRFARNHGIHIWLIAHPSKLMADKKTNIIPPPSLYDIAGSAHFVNKCDNGIVIHRCKSIDDTTEVYVRKVRFKHVGTTGDTMLTYNRMTGRFSPHITPNAIYSQNQGSLGIETEEAA